MPDPLFDSRTARFDLPLLFAGQSQKEVYVNEAASRIDALLHCIIEGELAAPPVQPVDGQCWLIAAAPQGDWTGRTGQLAARQSGQWLFFLPRDGLRLLNRANGQFRHFLSSWKTPARPALPTGGTVIDTEARTAIAAILATLTTAGVTSPN